MYRRGIAIQLQGKRGISNNSSISKCTRQAGDFAVAIKRVKMIVAKGGHNVPEQDIRRRFEKGWNNFNTFYKPLADSWTNFDTSGDMPVIVDESE